MPTIATSMWAANEQVCFFQAEDGIRDGRVTGVQTCALPIYRADHPAELFLVDLVRGGHGDEEIGCRPAGFDPHPQVHLLGGGEQRDRADLPQIHPDRVVGGGLHESCLRTAREPLTSPVTLRAFLR